MKRTVFILAALAGACRSPEGRSLRFQSEGLDVVTAFESGALQYHQPKDKATRLLLNALVRDADELRDCRAARSVCKYVGIGDPIPDFVWSAGALICPFQP